MALVFSSLPTVTAPNTVLYDGNVHPGRSDSFHLDDGEYTLTWYAYAPDDYPEIYCGIAMHVVTDDGYDGTRLVVNEEIFSEATNTVNLNRLPAGMWNYNVFGCSRYDIDIAPTDPTSNPPQSYE